MRRRFQPAAGLFIGIGAIIIVIAIVLVVRILFFSPANQAKLTVEEFYLYEQEGDFSNSWNLFHPLMKEKFTKGHYIQDRAHVFMNHFGVETFTFTISEPEELKQWKLSKEAEDMQNIYKFSVTQTYKGKYGHFDLHQNIFTAKEKDEWRILWDYNK